MPEQRHALRSLREEEYRTREINLLQILLALHHDGRLLDLSREAHNLGVASLTQDHHLTTDSLHPLVCRHNLALQLRHNGARRIDKADAQLLGTTVGRGGLAVGADEEIVTTQLLHIAVGDGTQAQRLKTLHLHTVMHNIAQRIDFATKLLQRSLGSRDGAHNAKAETRILVNLDIHHYPTIWL